MAITEEDEGAASDQEQDEEPDSDPDVQEPAPRQLVREEVDLDALNGPEAEQAALERQVDQLIEMSEGKDDRIVLLERQLADAQKSAKVEKEKVKLLEKVSVGYADERESRLMEVDACRNRDPRKAV